jgi:hypothetical protein
VRCWYVTEVAKAANGVISEAAIVPPAHSPPSVGRRDEQSNHRTYMDNRLLQNES